MCRRCYVCKLGKPCRHQAPITQGAAGLPALPAVFKSAKLQAEVVLPPARYGGGWLPNGYHGQRR